MLYISVWVRCLLFWCMDQYNNVEKGVVEKECRQERTNIMSVFSKFIIIAGYSENTNNLLLIDNQIEIINHINLIFNSRPIHSVCSNKWCIWQDCIWRSRSSFARQGSPDCCAFAPFAWLWGDFKIILVWFTLPYSLTKFLNSDLLFTSLSIQILGALQQVMHSNG